MIYILSASAFHLPDVSTRAPCTSLEMAAQTVATLEKHNDSTCLETVETFGISLVSSGRGKQKAKADIACLSKPSEGNRKQQVGKGLLTGGMMSLIPGL